MTKISDFLYDHRLAVVGGAAGATVLLFPWAYRALGSWALLLALLPVLLAGGLFGLRVGLAAGAGAFLVSALLVALVSRQPVLRALSVETGILSLLILAMGGMAGALSDLRKKVIAERASRRRVETALRISEGFSQSVLQALSANIAVLNRFGEIVAVNGAWERFGDDNGALEGRAGIGRNYLKICRAATGEGSEMAKRAADGIQAVLEGRESLFTLEYPCHAPRQKRWFILHVTPLGQEQGGAVVSHINITDRVLSEQKLAYLATHDGLTGLYNRAFFDQELARLQEEQLAPVTLVVADIDGLKKVNDQQGHAAGDELLRRAAGLLHGAFRDQDAIVRIGGDEFAVILPGIGEERAQQIYERLVTHLREAPGGDPVSMSLGMATAPTSADLLAAFKAADERMYKEKEEKKRALPP